MKITIKIIIVIFCLLCLLKMPYGFYMFVRLIAFVGFLYLAYAEFNNGIKIFALPCVLIALLFNPIFKVYLRRTTWNSIDVIVAAALFVWILYDLYLLYKNKIKMEISTTKIQQVLKEKSIKELSPLTDYHWQRREVAKRAVEQMSKHPLSSQEIDKQIADDMKVNQRRK